MNNKVKLLELARKVLNNTEYVRLREQVSQSYLVTVSDKSRVDELREYGVIRYLSQYTDIVGIDCVDIDGLMRHEIVVECEAADTGTIAEFLQGGDWWGG